VWHEIQVLFDNVDVTNVLGLNWGVDVPRSEIDNINEALTGELLYNDGMMFEVEK